MRFCLHAFFFLRRSKKGGERKKTSKLTHASAGTARAHALLDRVLAVLVVDTALLRVAEDVVGLVDVLEGVGVAACEREREIFSVSSLRLWIFCERAGLVTCELPSNTARW